MKPAKLVNMRANKNKNIHQSQIEVLLSLYDSGSTYKEISNETGINYTSVKTVIRRNRKLGINIGNDLSELKKEVALHRHTMYASEVAKKYGKTSKWVYWMTKDSPDKDKFLVYRRTKAVGILGKNQRVEIKERVPTDKGFAKVKKTEKVFETKQPKAMRSVPMYDNKNTIKFVELDDPRSNEEIRSAWKEEQDKKLRSLAS